MFPTAMNSFFAGTGCANVAVYPLVCAVTPVLIVNAAAAIKIEYFNGESPCSRASLYYEQMLILNSQFFAPEMTLKAPRSGLIIRS
jgi:hypothetical protein